MKVAKIEQVDNWSFRIVWGDGEESVYRLSELQRQCPCASCAEGMSPPVEEEVRCRKITGVGRYGLRIEFTSGCMTGIYSFEMLKNLGAYDQKSGF
jgi:DUF971 family protein